MANFESHIHQSLSNLEFLGQVNNQFSDRYDWQVTIAYYVAVHLINAHLAKSQDLHYRSHEEIKNAISPTTLISLSRIDESAYIAYEKLGNCSRRARYLINDDMSQRNDTNAYSTSEKYLAKAIRNLDTLLKYFVEKYDLKITPINFNCNRLNEDKLSYFK